MRGVDKHSCLLKSLKMEKEMFIEKIHRDEMDEITGTKINTIKTKKINFQTPARGSNNSGCNVFRKDKECRKKTFPTPWIEISNKIPTPEKMKETIDDLGTTADNLKKINARFSKNFVIEYFPVIGNTVRYDKNFKENITSFINLGIFSKADLIGIPDFNENAVRFREKILFAEKQLFAHPEAENHDFIPYIRADSRKFRDKLSIIINEDISLIGIDYHGFSGISKTNFNKLQNFVRDLDKDILVKVGHLSRKLYNTNASTPHLMFYFGADITTERVYTIPKYKYDSIKKKIPPRELDSVEYFSSSDLGVMKKEELPDYFGVDCNCPYHRSERYNKDKKFFINDGDKMGNRAKICELFSGNLECERSKPSIIEDSYTEYLRNKKCMNATLDLKNNRLNNYISY